MTKPKTLEQLRADKERAETQLAQEQHKLERLENRKKFLEQVIQATISSEMKKITQPSGAATPSGQRHAEAHRCSEGFLRSSGVHPTKAKKRQSLPFYPLAAQGFRNVRNAPRVVIPPPIRNARVSPCEPLCAIFLREPSVCPLSLVKANVGHLCEKLKPQ